ncbi:MAG: EcsC family protein [Bradymonadaceae bacterium]
MGRIFITPKSEELVEAGALDREINGVEETAIPEPIWDENFKRLWKSLENLPLEEVLEKVAAQFDVSPEKRREVLATSLARQLGYSRLIRRKERLPLDPLWSVLSGDRFAELGPSGQQALLQIAEAIRPHRTTLHPMAALAAMALWLHSTDVVLHDRSRELLLKYALPDEPRWLYELVRELGRIDAEDGEESPLHALGRLQLEGRYWDVAALIGGFYLVRKYHPWYAGSATSNLLKACDTAAQIHPQREAIWLELMAEAAIGGRLSYVWLERPVKACVRLNVSDASRQKIYRDFDRLRLCDVDHRRLEELYIHLLSGYQKGDEAARDKLFKEVELTLEHNSTRAQRLLEVMAAYGQSRRVGSLFARIRYAIEHLGLGDELDELEIALAAVYVRNYAVEGFAVSFVRRVFDKIDWEEQARVSIEDLEMYLVISDYERAFEHLTCKFDGVVMEHADKDAAARTKYFVEKRLDPSRLTRAVRQVFAPMEWLGASIAEINLISDAVDRGVKHFEARTHHIDLREEILTGFKEVGVELETYEDIASLPVDKVEVVLKSQRQNRLLLGALVGGISGGLAPFSWGVLSLADIPIVLGLTADICSRFCWYYGFDPREHPELPMEILAVALGGSQPSAIEPMLLRQNLREYVIQKSVMVGAVAHGSIKHVAGRGMSQLVERQMGKKSAEKISAIARREVSRNLQRRAVERAPSKTLPIVGAVLGASLNVALLYDICEAAQAVLTDRFLERKYPDWIRHVAGPERQVS